MVAWRLRLLTKRNHLTAEGRTILPADHGLNVVPHVTNDDLARRVTPLRDHSGFYGRFPRVPVRPRLAVNRDLEACAVIFSIHCPHIA
jgi:hypothetical protein